jgi:hypothetical protein
VSDSDPGGAFANLDTPTDTSPFNSGEQIAFTATSGTNLLDGETYWWRVRARDPGGDNLFSFWSAERSFTIASTTEVSTWHQTTDEQFIRNSLTGITAQNDNLELQSTIGEYGTVDVASSTWSTVTLDSTFSDMVVVASARYSPDEEEKRSVRVRNKTTNSFEIKVDNSSDSVDPTGTTTVDWIAMEAGSWNIDNGAGTTQIIAGTAEDVTAVQNSGYSTAKGWTTVTFSPAFGSAPAVLANVSTENQATWAMTHVNDGTSVDAEPTGSQMGVALARSLRSAPAMEEDIDYLAIEESSGTNGGSAFEAAIESVAVDCCNTEDQVALTPGVFSAVPAVGIVQQLGENGGQGGWAVRDTAQPASTTYLYASIDEDNGDGGPRGHTDETVAALAFQSASGTILRVNESLTGTATSETIDFSSGTGPKWGEVTWSDTTPSTSTIRYYVEYASGTDFQLIPDGDLPGNSQGATTSPIDLGDLDFQTYDRIRLVAAFTCTDAGDCPTVQDWSVTWSEGIEVSGIARAYDRATLVTAGTVRIALNGVLQPSTAAVAPDGSWTLTNVNAFPGDVMTVFIDGGATSSRAAAIARYDGFGDEEGLELHARHLTLGSNKLMTLTNADLSQYDNGVSTDADLFFDVDAGNDLDTCVVGGCFDANLYVLASTTYQPDSGGSGFVDTHDLIIDGTFLADSNSITLTGSWDNQGRFGAGGSLVEMRATATSETIDSTGAATSSFFALTLGVGSGSATFTPVGPLDVDTTFRIDHGTYAPGSATTTIGGAFRIGAGGGFDKGSGTTTLDGSGAHPLEDLSSPPQDLGVLAVAGAGRSAIMNSDVLVTDVYIAPGATLDAGSGANQLEVYGDFTNAGVFTAQDGEVRFSATTTGRTIDPGGSAFFDLTFEGGGGNWAFAQPDVTAGGDLSIATGTVTFPTGTFTVSGSLLTTGGTFLHNNGTVLLNSGSPGEQVLAAGSPFYVLRFNNPGGTWTMDDAAATTTSDFIVSQGEVTLPAETLSVAGDYTIDAGGSFDANEGEVILRTLTGPQTVRAGGSDFYDVRFTGVGVGGADWLDSAWLNRTEITVAASEVDSTLTDFPVYLDLAVLGSEFFEEVAGDGSDIRITMADGTTQVPREIVSIATSTGTGEVHFLAPTLSDTSDTTFYVYYGNPSPTTILDSDPLGAHAVWRDYLAVYHLEEAAGGTGNTDVYLDSTENAFHGDDEVTTAGKTGLLGQGQDFVPASADFIDLPNTILNGENEVSVTWWLNTTQSGSQGVVSGANGSNDNEYLLFFNDDSQLRLYDGQSGGSNSSWNITTISDGSWRHYAVERRDSPDQAELFYNGVSQGSVGATHNALSISAGGLVVGQEQDSVGGGFSTGQAVDGALDELRFSTSTRSAAWYNAAYINQGTPTTFLATSTQESRPGRTFVDLAASSTRNFIIESGLVNFPSDTLTVGGSFDAAGGEFGAGLGEVRFDATTTGFTVDPGDSDLYDVAFASSSGGWEVIGNATATNDWLLRAAASFTAATGTRIAVGGEFDNSIGGATTWSGSTLALLSGTNYTVGAKAASDETYGTLEVGPDTDIRLWNSDAGAYAVASSGSLYSQDHAGVDGDLYLWGAYERTTGADYWSAGTDFDFTPLSGALARPVSVRFADGASARFAGSASLEVVGTGTATTTLAAQGAGTYDLTIEGATLEARYASFTDTATSGLALLASTTVTNFEPLSFVLSQEGASSLTVDASTIDENPEAQWFNLAFATSSGVATGSNVTASGTPASYWWFRETTGAFAGEAFDDDPGGNPGVVRWDDSGFTVTIAGTVFEDEAAGGGSSACATANVVRIVVDGGSSYSGSCDPVTGAYSIAGVQFSGDADIMAYLNDAGGGERAATVSRTPTGAIANFDLFEGYTIVRHEDLAAITTDHLSTYDSSDDPDIPFTATTLPDTLTTAPDTALLVWGGKTFEPGGDVTLSSSGSGLAEDGTLRLVGTSTLTLLGSETVAVGGSWLADSGSTFTGASGDIRFTATTTGKRLSSPDPLYTTTFEGAGGAWTVEDPLTVIQSIALTDGTLLGTTTITVEEGTVAGDGVLNLTGGTLAIERSGVFGGNSDWYVHDLTLGDGSTASSTDKVGSGTTTVSGTLTILGSHTFNAGDDLLRLTGAGTVLAGAGTFNAGTGTTTYAGTSAQNVAPRTYYDLVLAPEGAGSPTYTLGPATIEVTRDLFVGNGSTSVTATADTNDPIVDVAGDFTIASGSTFVAASANDTRVAGSYLNAGTLSAPAASTFVFDSADTGETIAAGASSFGNVRFLSAAGGWTLTESATATAGVFLTDAASFAMGSGTRLAVGGTFENSVADAVTDWATSTLALYGGSSFSVNASSSGGDVYDALAVSGGTDVRLWSSAAATYDVGSTSSLYSQDHAGVDGDLYLWGAYQPTAANDHWSFARDFDGTPLDATSSRPVSVRIAPESDVVLRGGSLSIAGTTSATTTISAQAPGTFALSVAGGSFGMQYAQLRDVATSGLTFTGTPTVTPFENNDLELEIDTGSIVTVGGGVIDANPLRTFRANRFGTSTGVATGTNVTATGTSIATWRFPEATGALQGESFDEDPGGDPGYLIWDDSDALITIQGTVYSDEGTTVVAPAICDGTTEHVTLVVGSAAATSTTCDGSGQYTFTGIGYTEGDPLIVYLEGSSGIRAAAASVDPVTNILDMDLYQDRVIVRHEDTNPITVADLANHDQDDDPNIPFDAEDLATDTLTLDPETKLLVWGSKEFAPGGTLTLQSGGSGASFDGTLGLRQNAQFTAAGTEVHQIGGSLVMATGSTLVAASSTLEFTATTSGKTIDHNGSTLHTVRFAGAGGGWSFLEPFATTTGDVEQSAGSVTFPDLGLSIGGSVNVTGGSFSAATSGVWTFTAATGSEVVRLGGSAAPSLSFAGGAAYTFPETAATSSADVTLSAGSATFPAGVLSVGGSFDVSGGSMTAPGELRLFGPDLGETITLAGQDLNSLTTAGAGSWSFSDARATTTGDLRAEDGSLTAPTQALSVGGSFFAASSTAWSAGVGELRFVGAAGGNTITTNGALLNEVIVSGTGSWTLADSATTTGAFRLLSAGGFTQSGGTTLEVGGVFENRIGDATTWSAGSTLYLNAGLNFLVGAKTDPVEAYANLRVGSTTDVALWRSSATTYDVADEGSLYSQDHLDQDGDLFVWGTYERSAGSEFWEHNVDFDGASLSGGSQRGVDVRVASGSALAFSGGTVSIQGAGDGSATTTVDVQGGTGAFSWEVTGGTFSLENFAVRGLDAAGLMFSGAPTVDALATGEFTLTQDGGTLMTVASTTFDQNPTKLFAQVGFATSSGVATGSNVTVSGTTANFWTFVNEFGVLAGEDYDVNDTDQCGAVRWTDSTCLEVSQAHYRFRADNEGEGVPAEEWFSQSWDYRKRITVSNTGGALTNYPVRVTVDHVAGNMQPDFDDLRFTDASGTTSIPYYIESKANNVEAAVWVEVPSIPANGSVPVYLYYGNGGVGSAASSTETFSFVDDFEDNDIDEYAPSSGNDKDLFSVGSAFNFQGSLGLGAASGQEGQQTSNGGITRDAGGSAFGPGETLRVYQYVDAAEDDEPCFLFSVQGFGDNYAVCLDQFFKGDRVTIAEDVDWSDDSGTVRASTSVTYATGWYQIEIDWLTSGTFDVSVVDDSSGVEIASLSYAAGSPAAGGIGFSHWGQHGGFDFVSVRPYTATEPTTTIGSEQLNDGASWAAPQDSPQTRQLAGENFRLRISVENSGAQITGQQFRLQYAEKGSFGTCEAVPSVDYNDVPDVAGCGSTPLCMVASPQFADQDPTSQLLDTDFAGTFVPGYLVEDPSNEATAMDLDANEFTEIEYAIELTGNANQDSYCLRTSDGGIALDSYPRVPEVRVLQIPQLGDWTLAGNYNGTSTITLTEGTTTAVVATGTVTDLNGADDIIGATSTLYRSGLASTTACAADENNCYRLGNESCDLDCAGNSCDITCTADVQFFADPTDIGPFAAEHWLSYVIVEDRSGEVATATSLATELDTTFGIRLTRDDINFGTLTLGTTTGSVSSSTLRNTGNASVDVDLAGSDLVGGASTIPVGNIRYATSTFTSASCAICNFLSSTTNQFEIDLPKPTSSSTPITDDIFWGITIPSNTGGVTHQGQNTFFAVSD